MHPLITADPTISLPGSAASRDLSDQSPAQIAEVQQTSLVEYLQRIPKELLGPRERCLRGLYELGYLDSQGDFSDRHRRLESASRILACNRERLEQQLETPIQVIPKAELPNYDRRKKGFEVTPKALFQKFFEIGRMMGVFQVSDLAFYGGAIPIADEHVDCIIEQLGLRDRELNDDFRRLSKNLSKSWRDLDFRLHVAPRNGRGMDVVFDCLFRALEELSEGSFSGREIEDFCLGNYWRPADKPFCLVTIGEEVTLDLTVYPVSVNEVPYLFTSGAAELSILYYFLESTQFEPQFETPESVGIRFWLDKYLGLIHYTQPQSMLNRGAFPSYLTKITKGEVSLQKDLEPNMIHVCLREIHAADQFATLLHKSRMGHLPDTQATAIAYYMNACQILNQYLPEGQYESTTKALALDLPETADRGEFISKMSLSLQRSKDVRSVLSGLQVVSMYLYAMRRLSEIAGEDLPGEDLSCKVGVTSRNGSMTLRLLLDKENEASWIILGNDLVSAMERLGQEPPDPRVLEYFLKNFDSNEIQIDLAQQRQFAEEMTELFGDIKRVRGLLDEWANSDNAGLVQFSLLLAELTKKIEPECDTQRLGFTSLPTALLFNDEREVQIRTLERVSRVVGPGSGEGVVKRMAVWLDSKVKSQSSARCVLIESLVQEPEFRILGRQLWLECSGQKEQNEYVRASRAVICGLVDKHPVLARTAWNTVAEEGIFKNHPICVAESLDALSRLWEREIPNSVVEAVSQIVRIKRPADTKLRSLPLVILHVIQFLVENNRMEEADRLLNQSFSSQWLNPNLKQVSHMYLEMLEKTIRTNPDSPLVEKWFLRALKNIEHDEIPRQLLVLGCFVKRYMQDQRFDDCRWSLARWRGLDPVGALQDFGWQEAYYACRKDQFHKEDLYRPAIREKLLMEECFPGSPRSRELWMDAARRVRNKTVAFHILVEADTCLNHGKRDPGFAALCNQVLTEVSKSRFPNTLPQFLDNYLELFQGVESRVVVQVLCRLIKTRRYQLAWRMILQHKHPDWEEGVLQVPAKEWTLLLNSCQEPNEDRSLLPFVLGVLAGWEKGESKKGIGQKVLDILTGWKKAPEGYRRTKFGPKLYEIYGDQIPSEEFHDGMMAFSKLLHRITRKIKSAADQQFCLELAGKYQWMLCQRTPNMSYTRADLQFRRRLIRDLSADHKLKSLAGRFEKIEIDQTQAKHKKTALKILGVSVVGMVAGGVYYYLKVYSDESYIVDCVSPADELDSRFCEYLRANQAILPAINDVLKQLDLSELIDPKYGDTSSLEEFYFKKGGNGITILNALGEVESMLGAIGFYKARLGDLNCAIGDSLNAFLPHVCRWFQEDPEIERLYNLGVQIILNCWNEPCTRLKEATQRAMLEHALDVLSWDEQQIRWTEIERERVVQYVQGD